MSFPAGRLVENYLHQDLDSTFENFFHYCHT